MHNTTAPKQALRIALLGYRSHPHVGGQGVYIQYLSKALADMGHEVDVLSGPPYPNLSNSVNLIKIPSLDLYESPNHIRALRWKHLKSFSDTYEWWSMATGGFAEPYTFGRRVSRYLKLSQKKYDVIHDNQSLCHGLIDLQNCGYPVVSTIHHPITRDRQIALDDALSWGHKLLIKRWYSFLGMQKAVAQKLKHVVTVSQCSRTDISTDFGRAIEKTDVMYNGIDTTLFAPQDGVQRIPYLIITTSSSDQPLKGFPVLLKALKKLQPLFPDMRLLVVGKLKENGQNEKLMKALELQNIIHFKNGIDHQAIANEYAKASVAVCPSLYEGFGLPAGEAMSCGVPFVSADGGALPEVVGDAGLLVPAGNSDALADAIAKVFSDPALANRLSKDGRERILNSFCWNKMAAKLTEYYHERVVIK